MRPNLIQPSYNHARLTIVQGIDCVQFQEKIIKRCYIL